VSQTCPAVQRDRSRAHTLGARRALSSDGVRVNRSVETSSRFLSCAECEGPLRLTEASVAMAKRLRMRLILTGVMMHAPVGMDRVWLIVRESPATLGSTER
jgi:hypothetical protein